MTDYKYDEDIYLEELYDYVNGTYDEHYSQNKFQATEFIIDSGHGVGFTVGNVMKYAQRYGKKDGHNRKDILKVLHYAIMLLYVHDEYDHEQIIDDSELSLGPDRPYDWPYELVKPIDWDIEFPGLPLVQFDLDLEEDLASDQALELSETYEDYVKWKSIHGK